jgi:hypothetical protein
MSHIRPGPFLYVARNKQYGGNIETLGFTKLYIIDNTFIRVVYLHNNYATLSRNEIIVFQIKMNPKILEKYFEIISKDFSKGFSVVEHGSMAEYDTFKNAGIEYLKNLNTFPV